jgi:hypothetical protein
MDDELTNGELIEALKDFPLDAKVLKEESFSRVSTVDAVDYEIEENTIYLSTRVYTDAELGIENKNEEELDESMGRNKKMA